MQLTMMMHERERGGGCTREGAWIAEEERWVDRLSLLIRLSASTTTKRTRTTTTLSSASSQKSAMSVESVFISFPLTLPLSLCVALTLFVLLLIRHCILWCGLARANGKLLKACKRQSIVGLFNRQNIHIEKKVAQFNCFCLNKSNETRDN